ncbi:hypothetical protein CNECB9_3140011 [Cupriavidus necator]|uniref:Uncharacterized protein n=1 Tax=Cupriavidus necator TaxID=106590 RepID=A0A1K0IGK0_CUPNE|nr:hypothetical protein CNECB9_3140011 [Cupriavidus necator]
MAKGCEGRVHGCVSRRASEVTPTDQRLAFTLISFPAISRQRWLTAPAAPAKVLAETLVRGGIAREIGHGI